jgi:hypothetical protein
MNQQRVIRRVLLRACLPVVLCGIIFFRPKYGEVTLINGSGEAVVKATVEIDGRKFDFDDIQPGGIRKMQFKIQGDERYSVSVEFHYERTLGLQTGSFSSKVKTSHQLVIKHSQVVLESGDD